MYYYCGGRQSEPPDRSCPLTRYNACCVQRIVGATYPCFALYLTDVVFGVNRYERKSTANELATAVRRSSFGQTFGKLVFGAAPLGKSACTLEESKKLHGRRDPRTRQLEDHLLERLFMAQIATANDDRRSEMAAMLRDVRANISGLMGPKYERRAQSANPLAESYYLLFIAESIMSAVSANPEMSPEAAAVADSTSDKTGPAVNSQAVDVGAKQKEEVKTQIKAAVGSVATVGARNAGCVRA